MPFESGPVTFSIFKLPAKLPDNFLELFESQKAGPLDSVKEEPVVGWVSGRHLLESRIDEETAVCGGHIHLNMRTAERKIPASILKAVCRRGELEYMQANSVAAVPSKVRKDIKLEAIEKNLMKMPPNIAGLPFVVDMASNTLYLGTASAKQIENFIVFFLKTTELEPVQLTLEELLFDISKGKVKELPDVSFSGDNSEGEPTPGRDFLTWLWYFSESHGGKLAAGKAGDFEVFVEGPLTFAHPSDDPRGAAETTLKKGSPLRSAEAKMAILGGKKLKKAKLTIARGDQVWACSLDADKFCFGGMNLPEGEEMELHSRFAERVEFLDVFKEVMAEAFSLFVKSLTDAKWAQEEKKIQKWAQERDSF